VKPFAIGSLKAAITMAVYKHGMEQRFPSNPTVQSAILAGLPDAVIVTEPTGEILLLNHAAEHYTGWNRGECLGRRLSEVVSLHDSDGLEVWPSLFQQVIATGTMTRIPPNCWLAEKTGALSHVSGKVSPVAIDDGSADVFVILLDVTDPEKSNPPHPPKEQSTNTAEWMIALLCLPGQKPQPAGILVLDGGCDQLAIKLNTNIEIEDELVLAFWNELALDLTQQAQEQGGSQVVAWLEETASNIMRLSPRSEVDLETSSVTEMLEHLYHDLINPGSSQALSAQA
jgi:PAS domain S-box-containing protein